MSRWLQVYIVPAAVFVSVVMGGGCGTGREVVQFFTSHGLQGGLPGILVATLAFALILELTFNSRAYSGRMIAAHFFSTSPDASGGPSRCCTCC